MPIHSSNDVEKKGLMKIVELMAVSARTSPKTRGLDKIITAVVSGAEKNAIAEKMVSLYKNKKNPIPIFERDADNLRSSPYLLLVGVKGTVPKRPENPFNCGACGYNTCSEFIAIEKKMGEDFVGPLCVWYAVDLGIALCSAAKVASDLNADNRMMYTVGVAAKTLGIIDADIIVGIPISSEGKNIYFDRS